jgi:hypothetical protein
MECLEKCQTCPWAAEGKNGRREESRRGKGEGVRTRRDVGHGAWGMGHKTCWHADGMLMRPLCLSYSLPAGGDENGDAL